MVNTYPILKVWIDMTKITDDIYEIILNNINTHNYSVYTKNAPDSGFDLIVTDDVEFTQSGIGKLINHNIKCAMYNVDSNISSAYYLYARSSIFKTPLILANSVGIIDAGYRGNICSAIKYINYDNQNCSITQPYIVKRGTRITQLCHPALTPFTITIVKTEEELGITERGNDGFGSSGGTLNS